MTQPNDPLILGPIKIPADLAGRVVASLRGRYTSFTDGLSDAEAIVAVVSYWLQENLAIHEGGEAYGPRDEIDSSGNGARADRVQKAIEKARKDAEKLVRKAAEKA